MAAKQGPLIAVVGQTASGKSALAMELARRFDGEIIAADARTVYQGMDIGTAKPSREEQSEIRHHLLDVVTPDQRFTAVDFQRLASEAIKDVLRRGKLPLLVGGTGLYVDAVLFDYAFDASAERDEQNPRHAKRGGSKSELRSNTLIIGLDIKKDQLEQRITQRVDQMLERGLQKEVRQLAEQCGWQSPGLSAIGYREWQTLFSSQVVDREQVRQAIITDTRQYAKRQKTWFRRNKSIQWLSQQGRAIDLATTFLAGG